MVINISQNAISFDFATSTVSVFFNEEHVGSVSLTPQEMRCFNPERRLALFSDWPVQVAYIAVFNTAVKAGSQLGDVINLNNITSYFDVREGSTKLSPSLKFKSTVGKHPFSVFAV